MTCLDLQMNPKLSRLEKQSALRQVTNNKACHQLLRLFP